MGVASVADIQKEVEGFGLLLNQVIGSVGKPGRVFNCSADPTVWGTLGSTSDRIDKLRSEFLDLEETHTRVDGIEARMRGLELDVGKKGDESKDLTKLKEDGVVMTKILKAYNDRLVSVTQMCQDQQAEIRSLRSKVETGGSGGELGGLLH